MQNRRGWRSEKVIQPRAYSVGGSRDGVKKYTSEYYGTRRVRDRRTGVSVQLTRTTKRTKFFPTLCAVPTNYEYQPRVWCKRRVLDS